MEHEVTGMITMTDSKRKVTALLMQPMGRDGAMIYRVYWQDESGREKNYTVDSDEFWQIHDAAGQPSYTEPGYWTYEVTK
jgi:hypothetical protein